MCRTWYRWACLRLLWRACPWRPLKLTPLMIEQQRGSRLSRRFPVFLKTIFALDRVRVLSTLVSHLMAIQRAWLRGSTCMVVDRGPLSLTIAITAKDFDCRCPWRESITCCNVDWGYGGLQKSLTDEWWQPVTVGYTCFVQHYIRERWLEI